MEESQVVSKCADSGTPFSFSLLISERHLQVPHLQLEVGGYLETIA